MVGRAHIARRRVFAASVLALLWALGCGQQIELPEQPDEVLPIPKPGTYNLLSVWTVPSPSDLAVSGLYVFVIEENHRLGVYSSTRLYPFTPSMVSEFEGLQKPVQVTVTKRDSLFVIVADSADMTCKIYYWLGGEPLYTFTDSLWRRFDGLAADPSLTIYVSDAARDTIQAYDRWGNRQHVVSDYGTGSGYVIDPRGIAYSSSRMLIVADEGKNWVQRLEPKQSNVAAILEPIGIEEDLLSRPHDVAADPNGEFVFVADTGHDQVLKFLTTGSFEDTVYSHAKIPLEPPVDQPAFICALDSLVFLSDSTNDRIVLLQLAVQ